MGLLTGNLSALIFAGLAAWLMLGGQGAPARTALVWLWQRLGRSPERPSTRDKPRTARNAAWINNAIDCQTKLLQVADFVKDDEQLKDQVLALIEPIARRAADPSDVQSTPRSNGRKK